MTSLSNQQAIEDRLNAAVKGMGILVLARMIGTNRLVPSKISTPEELFAVLQTLGRTQDDAFEIHIERVPKKLESINACLDGEDPESAVIQSTP